MDNYSFFNEKTILITGSNGFVSRNIVDKLSLYNCRIIGIGIKQENKNKNIEYIKCDITNLDELKKSVSNIKPNFIFNLAAIVTAARDYRLFSKMLDVHVKSLYNFHQLYKNNMELKLFINFGSTEEYGDYNGLPFEESFYERSLSPYAVSKTAGIHFSYMIAKNEKFPIINIRPGVLFGKYQSKDKFIPYLIEQLLKDKEINLTEGNQSRDFIYIDNFIDILFDLIKSGKYKYGDIYNISSGQSIKLKTLVEELRNLLESNSKINYGALSYRDNEIMNFNISIEKIKKVISLENYNLEILEQIKTYLNKGISNNEKYN